MLTKIFAKRPPKDVVAEVHNEFNSASEKFLSQSKEYLKELETTDKGEKLLKFGFISTKEAIEESRARKKREEYKKNAELAAKYSLSYPSYKFITEDDVEAICKKYGLLLGAVSDYKGFVPIKNLLEIERFKGVKDEDKIYEDFSTGFFYREVSTYEAYLQYKEFGSSIHQIFAPTTSNFLKICAPGKDMETYRRQIKGHKIVPDPVVLQPINGGYLILTAWGDEASDPVVVNEKMN